ncbi:MAG: hypothetical protein CM1200mP28_15860 [Deltaproteobacteria bacterium]|nr:MAG: hypothetical protein CM1200mP28_15860 [Deltaproteobacteria bacterium]
MNNNDPIVIAGMARTPMGGFQGVLREYPLLSLEVLQYVQHWSAAGFRLRHR